MSKLGSRAQVAIKQVKSEHFLLTFMGWLRKGWDGMGVGAAHVPATGWQDRARLSFMLAEVLLGPTANQSARMRGRAAEGHMHTD